MKKKYLSMILVALMLLAIGCQQAPQPAPAPEPPAPEVPTTVPSQIYEDGTYSAQAAGFGGVVTVTITLSADKVTDCAVEGPNETAGIGAAALQPLADKIKDAGNAEVDAVSGATITSAAVKAAAADCFNQAKGVTGVAPVKMQSGTYLAEAYGFNMGWSNKIEVTVNETAIVSIAFGKDSGDTPPMLETVKNTLFPRMVDSQSIDVDMVSGATATSNSAKLAIEDCLKQALKAGGSDEAAINAFKVLQQKPGGSEEITTQVLVIGMGGSGTYSGLRAAEEGAQVLIIERQARYGGTTALTSEIMSINPTRIQKTYNDGKDFTDKAALYKAWTEYTEGDAKKELLDMFFENSGNALDWLAIDNGIQFDFDAKPGFTPADWFEVKFQWYPNFNPNNPEMRMFGANKVEIAANFDKLVSKFTSLGGKYMLETEGYELLTDASGAVIGAKAKNLVSGKEYTIHADAVILATGGFLGSEEMTKKYLSNEYFPLKGAWNVYGTRGNEGKMLQAAIDIGAATYNIGMPPEVHMSGSAAFIPHSYGFAINEIAGQIGAFSGTQSVWSVADLPMYMGISSNSLAVGMDGKRFAAETGIAMLDPWIAGPNYYSIWSADQINDIRDSGLKVNVGGVASAFLGYLGAIPENTPLPEAYDVLQAGIECGFVFKADTVEALAAQIGLDPAALSSTISAYNSYCASGADEEFGKDAQLLVPIGAGPFYAVKMASYSYNTCAGLDVDTQLRVLNTQGKPIDGLYSLGSDSAGVLFSEKKPYVTFGGANNGWVLTSAYVGGKAVADYVKAK